MMELWQAASFLGVGDRDVVIRGSRGLTLPKPDDDESGAPGLPVRTTPPDRATWGMSNVPAEKILRP